MKSIKELKTLKGKRVIVRMDFNVPLKNGKVVDDFRIIKSLPTILYLMKKGAIVILISHIGDDEVQTLEPVLAILKKHIKNITFIRTSILSYETEKSISMLKAGSVALLENLRREKGEKKNDVIFARALSRFGDYYVNDAFSVSHRMHASVVGLPKFLPSYAGFQLEEEIKHLSVVFENPLHPFLFILGGAKFDTKLPLIKRYLPIAETIFIGGALANQVFKEQGYETGASLVEDKSFNLPRLVKNPKIMLPSDVMVFNGKASRSVAPNALSKNDNMLDIGPRTLAQLEEKIKNSKMILWNGPLGKSGSGFDQATRQLLKAIAASKAISVIGGGDTVEIISKLKMEKKFTFVSTGGGATLEFLSKGTLPGIKALK